MREVAVCFFCPPGRRWPEGSDEGKTLPNLAAFAPYTAAVAFWPAGRLNHEATYYRQMSRRKPVPCRFDIGKPKIVTVIDHLHFCPRAAGHKPALHICRSVAIFVAFSGYEQEVASGKITFRPSIENRQRR